MERWVEKCGRLKREVEEVYEELEVALQEGEADVVEEVLLDEPALLVEADSDDPPELKIRGRGCLKLSSTMDSHAVIFILERSSMSLRPLLLTLSLKETTRCK